MPAMVSGPLPLIAACLWDGDLSHHLLLVVAAVGSAVVGADKIRVVRRSACCIAEVIPDKGCRTAARSRDGECLLCQCDIHQWVSPHKVAHELPMLGFETRIWIDDLLTRQRASCL